MSSQVKRKAAEADEMIRQMAAAAQGQQEPVEAPPSDEQPAELEAQPLAEVVDLQPDDEQSAEQPVENNEPIASVDELEELKEQARKADARWRSLQGQIDSKDRQIEQLHALLANMQEVKPAEQEQVADEVQGYTQADEDAFGADMIDLVKRVSGSQIDGYKAKITELETELSSLKRDTASTVQDTFEGKLTKLAPTWQELNADTAFITWLQESPTRQQMFQTAAQGKDAPGVAEFFNMYANLNGLGAAAPEPKPSKRDKLERQLAPGKARSSAPQAASTPEEKTWTRSEIAKFYTNKSQYAAEEFNKIEREISRAMASNRVDYTN